MEKENIMEEAGIAGVLKAKYFIIQEVIDEAEERHTKAVRGLAEPIAKEQRAKHEAALLKLRIASVSMQLEAKKKELVEMKEDLGEAKSEVEENKDLNKEFREADIIRTDKLEDVEEKCKEAKDELFEVKRKFNEATLFLSMRQCDLEGAQNRLNSALRRIAEVDDMKAASNKQMASAEKRGGKSVEREEQRKSKIAALEKQVEDVDDVTEQALLNIAKCELKREYQLDEIEHWHMRTQRVVEEINRANQEDGGDI